MIRRQIKLHSWAEQKNGVLIFLNFCAKNIFDSSNYKLLCQKRCAILLKKKVFDRCWKNFQRAPVLKTGAFQFWVDGGPWSAKILGQLTFS